MQNRARSKNSFPHALAVGLLVVVVVLAPAVGAQFTGTPKYSHRGFMLDTARKFFPVSSIYAILDRMYTVKMNVFHWHLTDSQSFPLDWSYNNGLLTSVGSFKNATTGAPLVYTAADVRAVVAYAAARGIEVIPEFEMPGHADVWALAFPNIIAFNPSTTNPSGQFDLAKNETYTVLAHLFADMLPLFISSRVHFGGDEVAFCWTDPNPKATYQAFYNTFVLNQARSFSRTPIVWADTVLDAKLQLPTTAFTVQTWRNAMDPTTVSTSGYNTIVSTSATWYVGNATPTRIKAFKFPTSSRIIGAELVWFTSPGDDPSDLSWVWGVIDAAGKKMWSG